MANPTGANAKAGQAVRQLVDAPPTAGTNTFLVTHKTNIADAFGKEAGDVQEGEAFIYKANGSGPATFAGRIKLRTGTRKQADEGPAIRPGLLPVRRKLQIFSRLIA